MNNITYSYILRIMQAILDWKTSKNITQSQIAKWLGKTQPAVSDILNGKTDLHPDDAKILIEKSKGELNFEKIYGGVKSGRHHAT